jgi:hypothetical protein
MTALLDASRLADARSISEHLNHKCFCINLDRDALHAALVREAGDANFCTSFIATRPHLFSNAPVFLPGADIAAMAQTIQAIEATARLPIYQDTVLSWAPEIAQRRFGPLGVFMGYDFRLTANGPRLIEINTNAGGAFLNALLARACRACCVEIDALFAKSSDADVFETSVLRMFDNEWSLQRNTEPPRRIAIVDDRPEAQYLYPEFCLAQRFFLKHGIESVIVDAAQLRNEGGRLMAGDQTIDLVYNRLVDFSLDRPEHEALRSAYLDDAVVVTPSPHVHAIFANKRNLTLLSDEATLRAWDLSPQMIAALARVPRTTLVETVNAQQLWEDRRNLFFKPVCGHGSKAVYRGDKVTKGVWGEINQGGYVAQEFAAPSERMIKLEGTFEARKADVRLFVYNGQILLTAARLYQGQATNFRTPGGGFAPVFAI